MKEIKNIGYIYKITNLINGKIYIGQTSRKIKDRWVQYIKDSKRDDYPLHCAIRKYGVENFKIEEIEKCNISQLNEREIYWISFYNSYHNGYNATLGGEGSKTLELNELEVIEKYKELKTVDNTANFYLCKKEAIRNILNKHGIIIKTSMEHAKEKGNIIRRYSLDKKLLEEYQTLRDAGRWVVKEGLSSCNNDYSESLKIRRCIEYQEPYLNFLWECDNYELKEKQLRIGDLSKKDFQALIKNNSFENICKQYNVSILTIQKYCKKYLIPFRKKDINNISDKDWEKECNLTKEEYEIKYLKNEKVLSKETLMQLVRDKSFVEISDLYNVSDNTVRKWCKKYLIPFRKEDINNIFDEDWEKECNLTKEEYEVKYLKNKGFISDKEIINSYKELKSLKAVCKKYHKDINTVKKILKNNNIELYIRNKSN